MQQSVIVRLRIVKQSRKRWGLYAAEFIQRGEFICEYAVLQTFSFTTKEVIMAAKGLSWFCLGKKITRSRRLRSCLLPEMPLFIS
ncbi:hypothetical protein FRX31_012756 [Thalictrum thalictroides]|uniref:Uncharacterized protein n=1 Tax=Thalictrum thalictroides TaxID=46969 RepID=A0A7J6WM34_THATH|nr:hypothetical protein FRX31_012756 [Thalictrum thalictroides]